jgi:hypothetical protein
MEDVGMAFWFTRFGRSARERVSSMLPASYNPTDSALKYGYDFVSWRCMSLFVYGLKRREILVFKQSMI